MSDPSIHEKIEAYLTGQLPPSEAEAFRREMAANKHLSAEVELQRLDHDAMNLLLEKDLKNKMARWDETPPPNPFEGGSGKSNGLKLWLPIVIVGLLAIWGAYQFLSPPSSEQAAPPSTEWPEPAGENETIAPPSNSPSGENPPVADTPADEGSTTKDKAEKPSLRPTEPAPAQNGYLALAVNTYQTPSFSTNQRGEGASESLFEQASNAFTNANYKTVLDLLAKPEAGNQSQVRYLRGHAYFKTGQFGAAVGEFKAVASDEFLPNYQEAQWHLLLTYLAQMPATKQEFETLARQLSEDPYSNYQTEVKALLAKVAQVKK